MEFSSIALLAMLSGVVGIATAFLVRPPHRLSLVLLGAALIAGSVSLLLNDNLLQRTASWIAIALALIAIANSGSALIRRTIQLTRHS